MFDLGELRLDVHGQRLLIGLLDWGGLQGRLLLALDFLRGL